MSWETTLITYDGWKPIVEWNVWEEGVYFKAWNIYGPGADEILWRYADSSGHLRYHSDRNGNIIALLDAQGNGIEKYSYDVFGKPTVTDWSGGSERYGSWYWNRFLFQGREYFPELGLYDYRNRFYHPILGRFLQTDPTGFDAGDMNLFRYCGDDPVDGSDPTGLIAVDSTWSRLMHWQGNAQDSFNDIAEAYRNWQPAGTDGGGGGSAAGSKSISAENEGTRHAGGLGMTRGSDGSVPGYSGGEANVAAPGTDSSQGVVVAPTGKLSLAEANHHYRTGNGVSVAVQASKYRFRGVTPGSFNPATHRRLYTFPKASADWRVLGTVTLQANRGGNSFRVLTDTYNFEMHPWTQEPVRNLATMYGRHLAGEGTPYRIIFFGNVGLPTR